MRTEEEIRRIVREMYHSELKGMPDFGGVNSDHDGRYYPKKQPIILVDGATVWDDQQVNISSVRLPTADFPAWTAYKGSQVLAFDAASTDTIYFTAQLSHKYKEGSDIQFHIHYVTPDANSGNVLWRFTYSWASINVAYATETSTDVLAAAPEVADTHTLKEIVASISGADQNISSVLLCSLARIGGDATDTYGSNVYLIALDFHVECNSIGSRRDISK